MAFSPALPPLLLLSQPRQNHRVAAAKTAASLEPVEGILGTFTKSPEDATGKHTFDYFFSTPGLKSGPGRVGLVRTGSDHFPIEAVFKIP